MLSAMRRNVRWAADRVLSLDSSRRSAVAVWRRTLPSEVSSCPVGAMRVSRDLMCVCVFILLRTSHSDADENVIPRCCGDDGSEADENRGKNFAMSAEI